MRFKIDKHNLDEVYYLMKDTYNYLRETIYAGLLGWTAINLPLR